MTLYEAKKIADKPEDYDACALHEALDRLMLTRSNGGVRNSERAMVRLDRRLANLQRYLLWEARDSNLRSA